MYLRPCTYARMYVYRSIQELKSFNSHWLVMYLPQVPLEPNVSHTLDVHVNRVFSLTVVTEEGTKIKKNEEK